MTRGPKLPYAPLAALGTPSALAKRLGIDPRTIYSLRERGLTLDRADTIAGLLGCHPSELWPEWGEAIECVDYKDDHKNRAKKKMICPCGERFSHTDARAVYCSAACKKRHQERRRWASMSEERRAAVRDRQRAYQQEYGPGLARRKRLDYQANAVARRLAARAHYEANAEAIKAKRRAGRADLATIHSDPQEDPQVVALTNHRVVIRQLPQPVPAKGA